MLLRFTLHPLLLTAVGFLLTGSSSIVSAANNSSSEYFGGADNQDYLDWVAGVEYGASVYHPSATDPSEGIAIHWSMSDDERYIELGLAVRAAGWFGFGISENGGMTGSDMLLFEAGRPDTVTDAYVQEERLPKTDACQDWQLLSSSTIDSSDFLMIQVRRKLVTGDTQDLPLRNDGNMEVPVHRVVAAWGDGDEVGFHGSRTARGAIRWFSQGGDEETVFLRAMEEQSDGSFVVAALNYPVKAQDTEYAKFCVSGAELREVGVPLDDDAIAYLIGFEAIVDQAEHVHHCILTGGYSENNDVDCESVYSFDVVYSWAPGEQPLVMPENVGFPLGGGQDNSKGYLSFQIEIHYNNPKLKEGAVDSSGARLYFSTEPREHTAGVLLLGDPGVDLEGSPIPRGLSDLELNCPSECSALALGDEPVTVVREYFHMHQLGVSAYNQQLRDGQVVRTGKTEYFDFKQQGMQVAQQDSYEILPGDSFNTRCFYRNEGDARKFGLSSSDEMCMALLLYYPRKIITSDIPWFCGVGLGDLDLPACDSSWKQDVLSDEAPMERSFGTPSTLCPADSSILGETSGAQHVATAVASTIALWTGAVVLVLGV